MRSLLLLALGQLLFHFTGISQLKDSMDLKVYNNTSPEAASFGTNNNFKAIGIGKNGHVWAGTQNQGLFKFNDSIWEKAPVLTDHNINDIKTDLFGGIWIAQSGKTGAQAINGGINYFGSSNFTNVHFNALSFDGGLPTRNVRGIYLNNSMKGYYWPQYRVWSAHMADITAGVSRTGAVGRGLNKGLTPRFRSIKAGVDITNDIGMVQIIGGNENEVWAFAPTNKEKRNQILRYNAQTEQYIVGGDLDATTTNLPANFTARAICFDKKGRVWVGMQIGGVYIYENGRFHQVNFPELFPTETWVNNNAIVSDNDGNVYIGTRFGLVTYNGGHLDSLSSYKRYTNENGLPAAGVQAIAIDTFNNDPYYVKIATTHGIAFWNPNKMLVYNVAGKHAKNPYLLKSNKIRIAADGSKSTLFKIPLSSNSNNKVRIKEDPGAQDVAKYGEFLDPKVDGDTIVVTYQHPSKPDMVSQLSRELTLEVFDEDLKTSKLEQKIEIVRPPLMFVHGLGPMISSEGTFGNMRNLLINTRKYVPEQIHLGSYLGVIGFNRSLPQIIAEKEICLYKCISQANISAGKIDYVGHSMGGILGRLCLQDPSYKDDINKLITVNTPHSGSPLGNLAKTLALVSDKRLASVLATLDYFDYNAVYDLSVNSSGIRTLLNGSRINAKKVASYAIVTVSPPPAISYNLTKLGPIELLIALGTFQLNKDISGVMKYLYANEENDWAVSKTSQIGGLTATNPPILNQWHSSTSEPNTDVYLKVVSLLNADPDPVAKIFSSDGFHPNTISPPLGLLKMSGAQRVASGTLKITSPSSGTSFAIGSNVTLSLDHSNIDSIMIIMGGLNKAMYSSVIAHPSSFSFAVPDEYVGLLKVYAIGKNSGGYAAIDSVELDITISAILDSIKSVDEALIVPRNHTSQFYLNGYFNDNIVRNITGLSDITYSFTSGKASISGANNIHGMALGQDTLIITYADRTAFLPLEIVDESILSGTDIALPVRLGGLNGEYKENKVQLKWVSYDDVDADSYEVVHSIDGLNFTSIGTVQPANVNYTKEYTFVHSSYSDGKNFYQIRAKENTGKFYYTNTALISINERSTFAIKSNPVYSELSFIVNAPKEQKTLITLYDGSGKKVFISPVTLNKGFNNKSVDIGHLPTGYYFFEISIGTTTERVKILKN
jgi:pimeloyl-ACP methyl ester carboxylesterase